MDNNIELRIEKENEKYLNLFESYLKEKGFSEKTIRKHYNNVHFFIDVYLLNHQNCTITEAPKHLWDYFGYFLVYKCLFISENTMKGMATSIKKFYAFLLENAYVEKNVCEQVIQEIKDALEEWIEELHSFEDTTDNI